MTASFGRARAPTDYRFVAGIGATAGVIDDEFFSVIIGMSILTTLRVPPLLRRALARPAPSP